MEDPQIKKLAHKVDELIKLCNELDKENKLLKAAAADWQQERKQLIEKTEFARDRVESMISRLRELEQEDE